MVSDFDLDEQLEPEQFDTVEDDKPSKEVYKQLKEQKKIEKHYEKLNKEKVKKEKHKAKFHRINNANHYVCDKCGEVYEESQGSLMYNKDGEFAYCSKCLKELYPNYKKVNITGTLKKTDYLNNHWDTKYSTGIY